MLKLILVWSLFLLQFVYGKAGGGDIGGDGAGLVVGFLIAVAVVAVVIALVLGSVVLYTIFKPLSYLFTYSFWRAFGFNPKPPNIDKWFDLEKGNASKKNSSSGNGLFSQANKIQYQRGLEHTRSIPESERLSPKVDLEGLLENGNKFTSTISSSDGNITVEDFSISLKAVKDHDICTVSLHPIAAESKITETIVPESVINEEISNPYPRYFEVKIEEKDPDTVVAIGLCTGAYPNFRLCGWNKYSIGFHSDDGRVFISDAVTGGEEYDVSYGVGDTIGCGIDEENSVYFTKNGEHLGFATKEFKFKYLFANIGCDGFCRVSYRFGKKEAINKN